MENAENVVLDIMRLGEFLERAEIEQEKSPREYFAEGLQRAKSIDKQLSQIEHPNAASLRKAFKKVIRGLECGKAGRYTRAQRMITSALTEVSRT